MLHSSTTNHPHAMSYSDKPRCPKKRRLNRSGTLLDYFKPAPKATTPPRVVDNWFWGRLPTEVLYKSVFKFLTVGDITNLGHSCHQLESLVDVYRGPLPHIVREQLLPHKINYVNLQTTSASPLADHYYEVSRARTVRFLLKTARHRVVQVEFKLGNLLWTELSNHLVLLANPDHKKCWVEVKIYRQTKNRGTYDRTQLFENVVSYHDEEGSLCYYLEGYGKSPEEQYLEEQQYNNNSSNNPLATKQNLKMRPPPDPVSLSIEANQKACVDYLYKCAQRIARSPTSFNLPNLDYLLDQALPPSLRHLLAQHRLLPALAALPPRCQAQWKHRKAPSARIRRRFFSSTRNRRDQHGQLTREYFIHEIPWFRDWYPEEPILSPSNLLQSLPVPLVATGIVPFLDDPSELEQVCPKVGKVLEFCRANGVAV